MKKRILTVLLAVLVLLCVPALAEGETEDPVLQELAGTWEGTGNPDGGGSPIQLSVILNPDGTGSYTFEQIIFALLAILLLFYPVIGTNHVRNYLRYQLNEIFVCVFKDRRDLRNDIPFHLLHFITQIRLRFIQFSVDQVFYPFLIILI